MIAIARFLPRSHDFLTTSHDFLRAARLAVVILAFLLIAASSTSAAENTLSSWVWIFSSDQCSYYLDRNHVSVDDSGTYRYTIKTVYVDDVARQSHIDLLSQLAPSVNFDGFYFDIIGYTGYINTNPPVPVRHPVYMYCFRSDNSFIKGFYAKASAYETVRLGSVDAIVDAKARSWAVYRPAD